MRDLDPALKQRIADLGFSKVRELIRVLTIRNAAQWVEQAEKMSYFTLAAAVTDERKRLGAGDASAEAEKDQEGAGEGDDAAPPEEPAPAPEMLTREAFAFYPEQLNNVRLALQKAAELSKSDKKSHNLDLICLDFLASNDFLAGETDHRPRYLAKIEKRLGVRLVAFDQEGDPIYGIDVLKMVAESGGTE